MDRVTGSRAIYSPAPKAKTPNRGQTVEIVKVIQSRTERLGACTLYLVKFVTGKYAGMDFRVNEIELKG